MALKPCKTNGKTTKMPVLVNYAFVSQKPYPAPAVNVINGSRGFNIRFPLLTYDPERRESERGTGLIKNAAQKVFKGDA